MLVTVVVEELPPVGRALDVLACEGLRRRFGVLAPPPPAALLVEADELQTGIPLDEGLLVCAGGKVQTP